MDRDTRRVIAANDPDGFWDHQPSEQEYAAFEVWVRVTFGDAALTEYMTVDVWPEV